MKDVKDWIIGILLTIIFGLIAFSVNREMHRLDRGVEVLHTRVNDVIKNKADRDDVQRELSYVWKNIDELKKRCSQ